MYRRAVYYHGHELWVHANRLPFAKKNIKIGEKKKANLAKPEIPHTTTMASGFYETKRRPSMSMSMLILIVHPESIKHTVPMSYTIIQYISVAFNVVIR